MSSQTYSRSFLQAQATPEAHKQSYIEYSIIGNFINYLHAAAKEGKTRYIYTHSPAPHQISYARKMVKEGTPSPPPPPTITNDDLVAAFKLNFPDCDVSYEETWVEVDATNRVLKKGIVIDWS
jgi:hypothetical protein